MTNIGGIFGGSKVKAAQQWVNSTRSLCYQLFNFSWRISSTLSDLQTPPDGIPPFVKRASDLNDPWKKPYQYQYPGTNNPSSFDLFTTSPEGKIIGNWDTGN